MSIICNTKSSLAIFVLGAALAFTGCNGTKEKPVGETTPQSQVAESTTEKSTSSATPAPSQVAETPSEAKAPAQVDTTPESSGSVNLANWDSERSKEVAARGINSITATLGADVSVSAINAKNIKTDLVDDVSAMKIIFNGFKDRLDPGVSNEVQIELQTLGTGIDRLASLSDEELAPAIQDSRKVGSGLAIRIANLQESLGVKDPSIELSDFLIEPGAGFGTITKDSTTESIKAHYGEENYVIEERTLAPDFTTSVGILFPGDKEKELWVIMDEGRIGQLRVPNTSETSKWKTIDGLGLGSSLEDVYKVNGTHFEMSGLMQEYAGTVSDWRGGRLDGMRISIAKPIDDQGKYKSLTGDSITSDDSLLMELGPTVYSLGIQFQ